MATNFAHPARLLCPALLAAALIVALPAAAQNAATNATGSALPPAPANPLAGTTRFAGTVLAVDKEGSYQVRVADGSTLNFRFAPDTRLMTRQPATLAELAAGRFVGCTAVKGTGEALRATECHIFPEAMRGAGEGHNPMQAPDTTMTNGNVATMTNGAVQTANGSATGVRLKVSYQGGEQLIEASPQTEVTVIGVASRDQIKVGTRLNGAVRAGADGSATAVMLNLVP
jgi:hypothetical protein